MQYRSEIDGLRAVAILPVIFYHAGFAFFSGGYIGVDVFFVISGFLITSIILSELTEGKFSSARFYERRARRILPALFMMLFICLPFAWLWMMPAQFKDFLQSLAGVVFFASNFIFWGESNYFASAAEEMPLLHTWSLAVEEQYYIIIPLFLGFLWRYGRAVSFRAIVVLAICSFLLTYWISEKDAVANFYLLPTRAWELLIGSICAFMLHNKERTPNSILAGLGLTLIILSVIFYDETIPFPSYYTLAPVIGTALIVLFASSSEIIGKLLSTKPLVGLGLISYSAYLWHQPLFAFYRVRIPRTDQDPVLVILAIMSVVIAYFSWRFVERPFRYGGSPFFQRTRNFSYLFVVLALILTVFGASNNKLQVKDHIWYTSIIPKRSDPLQMPNTCFLIDKDSVSFQSNECQFGAENGIRKILLTGDSHSASLFPALNKWTQVNNVQLDYKSSAYCLPLVIDFPKNRSLTATKRCEKLNMEIGQSIRTNSYDLVVLSAHWIEWFDQESKTWTYPTYKQDLLAALMDLSKTNRVVIVGQFPIWSPSLVSLVTRELRIGQSLDKAPNFSTNGVRSDLIEFDHASSAAFTKTGANYYSIVSQQCVKGACQRYSFDKGVLQLNSFDYGHLSKAGADEVIRNGLGDYFGKTLNLNAQ
jgi:peptidoglycan/LPS O-acetylase OafA/YrhL